MPFWSDLESADLFVRNAMSRSVAFEKFYKFKLIFMRVSFMYFLK